MKAFTIEPNRKTKQLAKLLGGDVYIVGGFVRNALLGKKCDDEDLCSAYTLADLEKKLEGSEFSLKNKNKSFGTCKIVCGDKSYDYATFRKEEYVKGHCPEHVEFVKELEVDANRRDFTINAIYYNLKTGEILDPFNGFGDLQDKRIRAINQDILKDDGLRILRMLRLAGEYGFNIEFHTLKAAQANIQNINDISKAKITEELTKLLTRTTNKGAVKAIKLYNRLGVWKRIGLDFTIVKPRMVGKCEDKFIGFLIDIVDTVNPASVSYYLSHICENAGFTKKQFVKIINVISGYYDALNHMRNKQYFFKYFDNFQDIYKILAKKSKIVAQKYNFFYKYIISHKLVIRKSDLKISEKDLKKHFPSMPEKMYESVLMEALSDVFDGRCPNDASELIKDIGKHHYHKF